MSRLTRSVGCSLCLLMVVVTGCNRTKPGTATAGAAGSKDGADPKAVKTPGSTKQIVPINRDPKSLEGNWVMVLTLQGRDHYAWIVRLSKGADGKVSGEVIDSSKDSLKPQIVETVVEEPLVKLKIKNTQAAIDFQGLFDGHAIRGTLANGVQELYTARLLNTEATGLPTTRTMPGHPAPMSFRRPSRP